MNNTIIKLTLVLLAVTIISCSTKTESSLVGNANDEIAAVKDELKGILFNVWYKWYNLTDATEYFRIDFFENYSRINEKSIVQSNEVLRAESVRMDILKILEFWLSDQQIKDYDKVVISNGRIHAFAGEAYVSEIFHPSLLMNYKDGYEYKRWQGTWIKD
jgi:hypothetical protein